MKKYERSWSKRALDIFRYKLFERTKFRKKGRKIDLRDSRSGRRGRFLWLEQKWWFWPILMTTAFLLFGGTVFKLSPGSDTWSLACGIIAGGLALFVCLLFYILRKASFRVMRSDRKAERTEWELERFIIVLLRGLRLPLKNIKESTKLLAKQYKELIGPDSAESEQITETAKSVFKNASDIDDIIQGLLRLRKLRKAEPQYMWLDMNSVIIDIVRNFSKEIDITGANVQMKDLPSCLGDSDLVKQVFEALVHNALGNLSQERKPIIRIWGWIERNKAFYCVEDNGIGIAEENFDKIFEIFYTLDPNAKKSKGLGLAIVRRIIERHAGRLWVKSELGKGSTFTVGLPVK